MRTYVISRMYAGEYLTDHIGGEIINLLYAFIVDYAEKNGYEIAGLARESYIDGIWNKESVSDWLTEVQLPVK